MQQGRKRLLCFLIIDACLRIARKVKDSTVRLPVLYNMLFSIIFFPQLSPLVRSIL